MNERTLFMFSGQGSQRYGMGHELYRNNQRFRAILDAGEDIVREVLPGQSLLSEMLDHNRRLEPFDSTLLSTPALYVFQYAAATAAINEDSKSPANFEGQRTARPNALLGYSLGEFVAAAVAEVYEFEIGLRFLLRYARLIQETCPPAGMLAILDDSALVTQHAELFRAVTVAGRNYPGSFVVTGRVQDLKELATFLDRIDVITQALPVSRGYHSALIDPAEASVKTELAAIRFREPLIPVYSCQLGRAITPGEYNADFFWNVVRRPIEFQKALAAFTTESARSPGDATTAYYD